MKRITSIAIALILSGCVALAAPNATVAATFEHDPVDPGVEYVIEERQGDQWVEVASGPSSPIAWTKTQPYGQLAVRCFYRFTLPGAQVPRDASADTSNVAVTVIRPFIPANAKVERKS